MFELFTNEAVQAIMHAQEEARRFQHNFVSTEQILLGLLRKPVFKADKVLMKFGVTYDDVRRETEKIIGQGKGTSKEIPFTPRGKLTLLLARDAAEQHRHSYIGPEHVFMGVIREGKGVASRVLKILGVNLPDLEVVLEKEFDPPNDDFEDVFYPAKTAEMEGLKASIHEMRSKCEQATAAGQTEMAQDALESLKALEWSLSWHRKPYVWCD
jgi:ATP-dependent Clp protease ATP-binding subunit ClpA